MSAATKAPHKIGIEAGTGTGIGGLLSVLTRHLYSEQGHADLGKLSDSELLTVSNQADNILAATENGLSVIAQSMSMHNDDVASFDTIGTGWLLSTLADLQSAVRLIQSNAESALLQRGYDSNGTPL